MPACGLRYNPVITHARLLTSLLSRYVCSALDTVRGLLSGKRVIASAEREFPSDKVYRRDDRGVIILEPVIPHSMGSFSVHTILDVTRA
jgi:hypothetical protein